MQLLLTLKCPKNPINSSEYDFLLPCLNVMNSCMNNCWKRRWVGQRRIRTTEECPTTLQTGQPAGRSLWPRAPLPETTRSRKEKMKVMACFAMTAVLPQLQQLGSWEFLNNIRWSRSPFRWSRWIRTRRPSWGWTDQPPGAGSGRRWLAQVYSGELAEIFSLK